MNNGVSPPCTGEEIHTWYRCELVSCSTSVSKSSHRYILFIRNNITYVHSSSSHLLTKIQISFLDFQEFKSLSRRTSVMASVGNFSLSKWLLVLQSLSQESPACKLTRRWAPDTLETVLPAAAPPAAPPASCHFHSDTGCLKVQCYRPWSSITGQKVLLITFFWCINLEFTFF